MVRVGSRADGVDGDFEVAVGAVFEADGAGQAAGQFAVHLAFGGARADGAPGDEVGVILRGNHVEEFGGGGYAEVVQIQQQAAGLAQAEVDVEGTVQIGVVDEAFPADGGTRFFKINAHDDEQLFIVFLTQGQQTAGVFEGGFGVVDGAGADNGEQAFVAAVDEVGDLVAGAFDEFGRLVVQRQFVEVGDGGQQFVYAVDADVVGFVHAGHGCFRCRVVFVRREG